METLALKNINLFSSLTEDELREVSEKVTLKRFRKNGVILQEEDTNEYMYMILGGKVKVVQISPEGKETILALHGPGDFFGEMSLIDGKTAPATVIATEPSLVSIISKKDFYSLLTSQDKVMMTLLQIFCSRIRDAFERIQMLSFSNASQRIKMLFLMLAEAYGRKTPKGIKLEIKLTHQNIADMTGIARETVTRILNRLQREGELLMEDRNIFVNEEYLKKDITSEHE